MNQSDRQRQSAARPRELFDTNQLAREFRYGIDSGAGIDAGMGRSSADGDLKLAHAFARGLEPSALSRRLKHQNGARAARLRFELLAERAA